MKNYLKLIVVVAGFTVAILSSTNALAKKKANDGGCPVEAGTCGHTPDGDVIIGKYVG